MSVCQRIEALKSRFRPSRRRWRPLFPTFAAEISSSSPGILPKMAASPGPGNSAAISPPRNPVSEMAK